MKTNSTYKSNFIIFDLHIIKTQTINVNFFKMKKISNKVLSAILLLSINTITIFGCASDDSTSQDPIENQSSIEIKTLEVSKITETTANLLSIGENQISSMGYV